MSVGCAIFVKDKYWLDYSCLPIKQAGSNKQAGWIISEPLTNKQAVINKQGGILVSIQ